MSTMRLVEWRPLTKGSLRGFLTVELPNGLIVRDVAVLTGRNGAWCSLPAKPAFDRDGKPKIGEGGRSLYTSILQWRDRALADRFSTAVVELLLSEHPGALDDGASP